MPALEYYCDVCHNSQLSAKDFYGSQSSLSSQHGKMRICKSCFEKLFDKYAVKYGGNRKAVKRLCMAYDIYYSDELYESCVYEQDFEDEDGIWHKQEKFNFGNFFRNLSLPQHRRKSFDTAIDEGFSFEDPTSAASVNPKLIEKWGVGFDPVDYQMLESHYKYLKAANPRAEDNQEIFITDLCYTKMQQMKAARENRVSDYKNLTDSYRNTFKDAGLRTVRDASETDEFTIGVNIETIEKYTPAEYYKDKKLYKDYDGLGDYFDRMIARPVKNAIFGTEERDKEFYIHDEDEVDDEEIS